MRDIEATIEQAKLLGSEKRFMLSEVMALHKRAISEHGKFDSYKLIGDSFNFGFMLGYRMGNKKSRKKASGTICR